MNYCQVRLGFKLKIVYISTVHSRQPNASPLHLVKHNILYSSVMNSVLAQRKQNNVSLLKMPLTLVYSRGNRLQAYGPFVESKQMHNVSPS